MNSQVRVVGNYRNQWASVLKSNAFSTYSASYDQKIPVGRYDYFGVGGTFWGDKAGQLDFKTLQAKVSASYSKRMGGYRSKSHYLVVGVEGGIAQRSIDFTRAQWASQHDGEGGFNGNLSSGENFANDNFIFPDFSAGLLWFTVFNERSNFYIGSAFSHLNRANQSFDPQTDLPLYSKFTVHAGGEFMGGGKIGIVPGAVALFQGPSFELNAGASLKFLLSNGRRGDHQSFQLGLWTRLANRASPFDQENATTNTTIWADAVIVSTRFDYNNFGLGFSYDLNVSDLNQASNGNGAFEFSIIYHITGEEKRDVYCPNF